MFVILWGGTRLFFKWRRKKRESIGVFSVVYINLRNVKFFEHPA